MSRFDSLSMAALAGVLHQVGRKAKPIARLARRGAADACSRRTVEKLKHGGDSMTPWSSRGGMRAFRERPMQPPFLYDPVEHRKRGPPPRQRDVIGYGRGRGRSVTSVSPREWLLSQNQSIHGAKLRSAMEKEESEERRGGEREEAAASANVTGLHSDVGVQATAPARRASCTDVHARAHTLILGVRRPLPARETVTDLRAVRPHPTPRLAAAPRRAADEHLRRRC